MASAFHLVFFLWMSSGLLIAGTGSAALPHDSKAPCCPPFWTQFGSRCFIFQNNPVMFDRAESLCQGLGGNLASIHNQKENMFVRELIHQATGSHPRTWIGGHDGVKEGHWMWTDGSKFDYATWTRGQPDNGGGKEHCVHTNHGEPVIPPATDCGICCDDVTSTKLMSLPVSYLASLTSVMAVLMCPLLD